MSTLADGDRLPPPAVADATLRPGDVVADRYRIVRFIAAGGMGEVFEVDDLVLGTRVALKRVRAELSDDDAALRDLRREVTLAQRVTHPNVCRSFDVGFDRAHSFLTMELLDGETLATRLRREGRLTTAAAAPLVADLIAALDSAHAAGVVHRDFKSQNVMLTRRGAVVTDFGLARATGIDDQVQTTTATGRGFVGTPDYMAPEQITRRPVTAATDIYALGVVMYEMVTGALPFGGDSPLAIASRRLEAPAPAARRAVPELDPRWDAAIARCLERDPRRRFVRAADIGLALRGPRPGRRRTWIAAAGLAVVGAGAGGAWLVSRRPGARSPRPPVIAGAAQPRLAAATAHAAGRDRLLVDDLPGAVPLLERAIVESPEDGAAHTELAETLLWLGDRERARAEAKRGLELSIGLPADARRHAEAAFHLTSGEPVKAVAIYRELFRRAPDDVLYGIELAANDVTPADEALATLDRLRRLAPPTPELPRLALIEAMVRLRSDPEAALAAAARARARAAAWDRPAIEAMSLHLEAAAYAAMSRRADQLRQASAARRLFAAEGLTTFVERCDHVIAEAQLALGNLDEAAAFQQAAAARAPDDPEAAAALAQIRFLQADLPAAAALARQAAAQLDREGARAVARAAVASLQFAIALERGDRGAADAHLRAALELITAPADTEEDDGARADVQRQLVDALLFAGRDDEARALLTRAEAGGLVAPLLAARLRAASGDVAAVAAARQALGASIERAVASGDVHLQLRARLIAGEVELAHGDPAAGRRQLEALVGDASHHGFELFARRARRALHPGGP